MDLLSERAQTIIELQVLVLSAASVEDFTDADARAAATHIAAGSHVGITLQRQGRVTGVASSDTRAAQCDERQADTECSGCCDSPGVVRGPKGAGARRT